MKINRKSLYTSVSSARFVCISPTSSMDLFIDWCVCVHFELLPCRYGWSFQEWCVRALSAFSANTKIAFYSVVFFSVSSKFYLFFSALALFLSSYPFYHLPLRRTSSGYITFSLCLLSFIRSRSIIFFYLGQRERSSAKRKYKSKQHKRKVYVSLVNSCVRAEMIAPSSSVIIIITFAIFFFVAALGCGALRITIDSPLFFVCILYIFTDVKCMGSVNKALCCFVSHSLPPPVLRLLKCLAIFSLLLFLLLCTVVREQTIYPFLVMISNNT